MNELMAHYLIENMQKIHRYFPELAPKQIVSFNKMSDLYMEWNKTINVIPRNEVESLYEKHVLHSLSIAKIIRFGPGSRILDVGTGGGFPGIPLAVFFPKCSFVLIDPIGNRIKVVQSVADELKLKNVTVIRSKVEDFSEEFDFVASRAVTVFPAFVELVKKNISVKSRNTIANGIIYLKGGSFEEEIVNFQDLIKVYEISNFFKEPYFETKKVIYLPIIK